MNCANEEENRKIDKESAQKIVGREQKMELNKSTKEMNLRHQKY
jgi:hypothetical protein